MEPLRKSLGSKEHLDWLNNTHRENFVLLNSVQEFIEIQAWLLLTFFLCLHNQLISVYYIVTKLKLVSAIFYQIFIFSPNDSPLKTMKNVVYFI